MIMMTALSNDNDYRASLDPFFPKCFIACSLIFVAVGNQLRPFL